MIESPGPSLQIEPSGWPRFELRQDEPGRYDITFRPPAWDMVGKSRGETVDWIEDEFRRHFTAALEQFEMDTHRPGAAAGPGEALDLLPPGGLDPRTIPPPLDLSATRPPADKTVADD